jgi:alkylhydroperoxidase/carboxymuconolactone decarboxylase family protein YurZ
MDALLHFASTFPDAAKDIRLNLTSVLSQSTLTEPQRFLVAIAVAFAARDAALAQAVVAAGGAHASAGEDHAERALGAYLAWKAVQAAGQGCKSDAWFRQGEEGCLGRNDDIAGKCNLETASHRESIDGGDDGLVQVIACREAREACCRHGDRISCRLVFQVIAGAEGLVACARDDGHPLVRVLREFVERLFQFHIGWRMQRVHHLGTVDGDDGEFTFALDLAEFRARHGFFLSQNGLACILLYRM